MQAALAQYRELQQRGGWQAIAAGETLKPGMSGERVAALRQRLIITADMPASTADPAVITSYSIHYTKLYDRPARITRLRPNRSASGPHNSVDAANAAR